MEKAAKGVTTPEIVGEEIVATTEEIVATTEQIVAEVKEEAIEAPSRLREKFRRLEAVWGRAAVQFYQAPKL
jgi:uncharacterized protein YukE